MWRIALLVSLSGLLSWQQAGAEEKKWRWGDGDSGVSARQDREVAASRANDYLKRPLARYEIFENEGGNFHRPGRPQDFRPPIDYQERPGFGGGIRPGRPGGHYGNGYDDGGYGGNGYGNGQVLTGPVPSWQHESPIKEFDRCKCTEKFNCNSPGISYGNCDVGKRYCCYSTHDNGVQSGPGGPLINYPGGHGGGPTHGTGLYGRPDQGQAVLVGPGGPTGIIGRPPHRPGGEGLYEPRPPHGPGVLVGPGGPTGIIGRPPGGYGGGQGIFVGSGGPVGVHGRPPGGYGGGPGVLVGPGGPTGIIGRPPGGGYGGVFGGTHDRPGFGGGYRPGYSLGRSAKDTTKQKEEEEKE